MRKKFILNLILLISLNILIKPFWVLGIDRSVQNIVGATEYGVYISLFNLALLFNFVLDIGISTYNNKNVAQDINFLNNNFLNIVEIKFLLALIYALFTIVLALALKSDSYQIKILILLILNQFLISYTFYQRSNIAGLHIFWADSIISVLDKSIMIILAATLLWGNIFTFSIFNFVLTQTIAYSISAILSTLFVLKKRKILYHKIVFKNWKKVIFESFPYALLVLLMTIYTRSDIILLQQLLPNGSFYAGIYAQSYRILDAAAMFSLLFATWLLPIFSNLIINKKSLSSMVNLSLFSLIVITLIVTISTFTFRQEIIQILYHSHVQESSGVLGILIFTFIAISVNYIFGTLITASGKIKLLIKIALIGFIINIGLNLIFIPQFKGIGAAISALSTQSIVALLQLYFAVKLFNVKLNIQKVKRLIIFIFIISIASYLLYKLPYFWIINFCIFVFISLVLSFLLKILNLKSLFEILKQK